jgi:perosamine synthetase
VIGYNYRMTNIAAAIGLTQLERVAVHLAKRKAIAKGYEQRLSRLSDRSCYQPAKLGRIIRTGCILLFYGTASRRSVIK